MPINRPRGCLRAPRGARLGVASQGPPGPSVPPSADPATSALPFRRARTCPLPPRSLRGHASGGGGQGGPAGRTEKEGRRRRPRRGRGKREPARAELLRPRPSPPRPGFLPSGGSLAPHAARGAGFVGPGRVEGPAPPPSRVVGGGGVCCRGGRRGEVGGVARGEQGSGERVPVAAVRRPPLVAARRPADRRSRAPPPRRRSAPPPSRPPRSLCASGAGSPPRGPPGRARGRVPGVCVPPAVTRGTPWRRPPSRARLRCAAAWCRAGAPSRASASGRGGRRRRCRRPPPPRARPPTSAGGERVGGGGARGVRPAPGACPSLPSPPPPRRGGGGRRRPWLSLARLLPSPGPSPDGASGRAGGRAGWRAVPSVRQPARPPPPVCASRPPRRDLRSDVATR